MAKYSVNTKSHEGRYLNLTIEQIQNIYTGEIKNWSEVGGTNEEIRPFQRPENSGSQTGMLSLSRHPAKNHTLFHIWM